MQEGGPAGLAAGIYCQRGALKTVLFEKGPPGGQIAISKEVENYPGMEGITGFDLTEKMIRHAQSFGLRIIEEEVVVVVTAGPGPIFPAVPMPKILLTVSFDGG